MSNGHKKARRIRDGFSNFPSSRFRSDLAPYILYLYDISLIFRAFWSKNITSNDCRNCSFFLPPSPWPPFRFFFDFFLHYYVFISRNYMNLKTTGLGGRLEKKTFPTLYSKSPDFFRPTFEPYLVTAPRFLRTNENGRIIYATYKTTDRCECLRLCDWL